jgi:Zn-finger nucleic acid-binding protein
MDRSLKGVLWQCSQCSGVAANLAVLRKLLGQDVALTFWREARASTPSDRPCPSCHQTLHIFTCDVDHNTIELDLCKRCQILWFDKGELEAFPVEAVAADDLPLEAKTMLTLAGLDLKGSMPNHSRDGPFIPVVGEMACEAAYFIIRTIAHIILRG